MKRKITQISIAATVLATLAVAPIDAKPVEQKRCPKIEPQLRKLEMPVETFSYIAWRESRCQPRAIGWNYHTGKSHLDCRRAPAETYRHCDAVASYDSGLFQINSTWVTLTSQICRSKKGDMTVLLEPRCNLAMAEYLYKHGGGLRNWGMHPSRP